MQKIVLEEDRDPGRWMGRVVFSGLLLASLGTVIISNSRSTLEPPRIALQKALDSSSKGLDEYERLLAEFPEIAEYIRLLQAKASMPDPGAQRILAEIIEARPTSPAAQEAHLSMARYYASLGDVRARQEYQAALELEDSVALRLEIAHYLEELGQRQEAYQAYKELISDFAEAFEGMRRTAPDPLTLAQDLIAATYYGDALEVLREPARPDDPRYRALRAQALFSLGRYAEAQEAYQNWLATSPQDPTARLGLARSLGRLGRLDEALEIYRDIDSAESRLAQAEVLESQGEIEAALALYRDLPYPIAWWRAASILEREGRGLEALPLYAQLGSAPTALSDDAAYRLYVLARRLDDREMQSQAVSLLEDAPSNYFRLLLGGGSFQANLAHEPAQAGDAILAKARALERLGLEEFARRELRMAARFNHSAAIDLSMAQALAERGMLQDAQAIADQALSELDPAPLAFWRLAFPKAYRREVEEAAGEFGLDPLLIWAVMRQESRYNPEAVSRSYAQGLMQIIPSTRDMIARQLGVRLRPIDIFIPRINVRLGAYYLRSVLDQFKGDVEYAVAAYNGGPANVERWLQDPFVVTKEDFYRWIDRSETREFVQKVMFNYRVYQWLEVMQGS